MGWCPWSPAIRPFDEQDLAAQSRFLRGLAGSLVADPASADDAVQEAWLAALRRRPDADRPLRPWLARVVVNAVKKLGRGRARRGARERAAARPEALPDARALREREQRLRGLLDAVLALPEREREAVLLRYYEALPPREIAARLRVPVERVYARLKHALALLRERLDAQHGGERSPWALGLVGVLGLPRELLPSTLAAGSAAAGATAGAASSATFAPTLAGAFLMSSSTVAAAVVSLALGAGAGWFLGSRDTSEPPTTPERAAGPGEAAGGLAAASGADAGRPTLSGLDPETALRKELSVAKETLAAREKELAEARERIAALAPPPFDPKALRFGLKGGTPMFDKADWNALSGHVAEMTKAMPRFRATLEAGKEFPQDLITELQEHNTPLAIFAVSSAAELKGTGPNGAYTHPAVISNLIRAALLQAGDPLTSSQEAGIVALGNAWAAEDERLAKALAPDAPALAATVAEVDAKQRFLEAVKSLLTPSQRGVLFRPETENRLQLDLLSPVLVYIMGLVPAEETDPALLGAKTIATLLSAAGVKDVEAASLAGFGDRWIDEIPRGREPHPPADPELRFPTVDTVQAFARAQVAAVQRLLDSGRLTPDQAKKVRATRSVVAPYLVRTP